jgi:hypothetical protein
MENKNINQLQKEVKKMKNNEYRLKAISKLDKIESKKYFNQLHELDKMIEYLENGMQTKVIRNDENDYILS